MKEVIAILTADWHIRENKPVCRIDQDFGITQVRKMNFISHLADYEYKCPVINSGDIFHYHRPSPAVITSVLLNSPKIMHTVLGNHDIPYNNTDVDTFRASPLNLVRLACDSGMFQKYITVHWEGSYGTVPREAQVTIKDKRIVIWHKFVWKTKEPFPGISLESEAHNVIRQVMENCNSKVDLIVTGDNHMSFDTELNGVKLVNPGPLTRQSIDKIDQAPGIYLYYNDGSIRWVEIPHKPGNEVMNDRVAKGNKTNYLEMGRFIDSIDKEYLVEGLDFKENLKTYIAKKDIKEEVKKELLNIIKEVANE